MPCSLLLYMDRSVNPWVVTISINDSPPVEFKIDTRADVSVISDTTYRKLVRKLAISEASNRIPYRSQPPTSRRPWSVYWHFQTWRLHVRWGDICCIQPTDVLAGMPSHQITGISVKGQHCRGPKTEQHRTKTQICLKALTRSQGKLTSMH